MSTQDRMVYTVHVLEILWGYMLRNKPYNTVMVPDYQKSDFNWRSLLISLCAFLKYHDFQNLIIYSIQWTLATCVYLQ